MASVLLAKGAFNENNTKKNYNKNYSKIINIINLSLFGFSIYVIIAFYLVLRGLSFYNINLFLMILFMKIFIFITYDIVIIIELILSYAIKKNEITWFMKCDYVLIILISLYSGIYLYIFKELCKSELCKSQRIESSRQKEKLFLTKFKDIDIYRFHLPKKFKKMKEYKKRKYIVKNKNKYKIMISESQEYYILQINKYRIENNINELNYDKCIAFKDLILDKYSEPIVFDNKNIFHLSDNNYLLKYPINEFVTRFNNKEKDIVNILLKDHLNKIIIVIKYNMISIHIFKEKNSFSKEIKNERIIVGGDLNSKIEFSFENIESLFLENTAI